MPWSHGQDFARSLLERKARGRLWRGSESQSSAPAGWRQPQGLTRRHSSRRFQGSLCWWHGQLGAARVDLGRWGLEVAGEILKSQLQTPLKLPEWGCESLMVTGTSVVPNPQPPCHPHPTPVQGCGHRRLPAAVCMRPRAADIKGSCERMVTQHRCRGEAAGAGQGWELGLQTVGSSARGPCSGSSSEHWGGWVHGLGPSLGLMLTHTYVFY